MDINGIDALGIDILPPRLKGFFLLCFFTIRLYNFSVFFLAKTFALLPAILSEHLLSETVFIGEHFRKKTWVYFSFFFYKILVQIHSLVCFSFSSFRRSESYLSEIRITKFVKKKGVIRTR